MKRIAPPPGAWTSRAACAQWAGLPWTVDSERVPAALVDLMIEVCAGCPVRDDCAAYVRTAQVDGGFWAGLDRHPSELDWEGAA